MVRMFRLARASAIKSRTQAIRPCCVNGGWAWQGRVVLRSDGEGEFGEGGRVPMLWVLIHAELVVATTEVLDEGVSGADHPGGAKLFEAAHRPQPSLESPMICFDEVVNRYERSSVVGLAGRSALGGVLVGIRCDRPGQGRWE